ncbi:MAG: hypothetical protein OJF50_000295 [Nitrospira sp.]|jgi:hypothetical protein|nr:hypothetical protein [Nitrospira sp.]
MTLDHPPLTHDEWKAAEAAFQDRPFNPLWSQKAQRIYDGIRAAQANRLANSQDSSVGLSLPSNNPSVPFHLYYSELAPLIPRIAQVWILEYQDTKERRLEVCPGATSIEQLLKVFRRRAHSRSFTIQMVDVASMSLPQASISSYSHDARRIDQDGFLA